MANPNEYRDLLDHWCKWWDGPGRENYKGNILPPLTRTREVMSCLGCVGVDKFEASHVDPDENGDVRCQCCGRKLN